MNQDLEKKLETDFAELLKSNREIACGDGWFSLLYATLAAIRYWDKNLKTASDDPVVVHQIKEKFGTLRFYYGGGAEYVNGVVTMAELMSATTCDVCGSTHEVKVGGKSWLAARCKEHQKE